MSYDTTLSQSPFDLPKTKGSVGGLKGTKYETPRNHHSNEEDEETISLADKRYDINFYFGG